MVHTPEFNVLVVDDNAMIRNILRNELLSGGYRVIEAVHGYEALSRVTEYPPPDLITLDVEMPKMNGFETCRKIRAPYYSQFFHHSRNNLVPIIFITSHDTVEDRERGFELGAMDFITKPFPEGVVRDAVNQILRSQRRLDGLTALMVNDGSFSRLMVLDCLEREGVTIVEVPNGKDAFDVLKHRGDHVDIVITDLIMDGMTGDELCRRIRGDLQMAELPVIVLPRVNNKRELFELFKAGATDYLLQPFVKEEFLARLIGHLERAKLNKRLRQTLKQVEDFNKTLAYTIERLTHIGTSLSSEKNLNKLLEMVVFEARDVTKAESITLFTLKGDQLHYQIVQNKSVDTYTGVEAVRFPPLPLDPSNIKGHCVLSKQIMHIPDVDANSDFDFTLEKDFDAQFGYQTRSLLFLPLVDRNHRVVGLLRLINSIDPGTGNIRPFPNNTIEIAYSLACQAAVCIENALSYEKIRQKNVALARFVPNEFFRFLNKAEIEEISLGEAAEARLTVLFSDIRSFTNLSEQMTPEENFKFLNNYLKHIGPVINANNGFIDKYIGDAIMALFGGMDTSGAQDAVSAAVQIQQALKLYNRYRKTSGYRPVKIGIGINTGHMILGTIGFESRMESTVIGDTVNLASRLEGLTKMYGICIAVSEHTVNALDQPEQFMLRKIDYVQVKGKQEPVYVYEVFDCDDPSQQDAKRDTMEAYSKGLRLFRKGNWRAALDIFTQLKTALPTDKVVAIYEQRCREYIQHPPTETTTMVTRFNHKF